jgi:cell division protein FtsL
LKARSPFPVSFGQKDKNSVALSDRFYSLSRKRQAAERTDSRFSCSPGSAAGVEFRIELKIMLSRVDTKNSEHVKRRDEATKSSKVTTKIFQKRTKKLSVVLLFLFVLILTFSFFLSLSLSLSLALDVQEPIRSNHRRLMKASNETPEVMEEFVGKRFVSSELLHLAPKQMNVSELPEVNCQAGNANTFSRIWCH